MADERDCIPDRHWLKSKGLVDDHLFNILGGMSQDHWEYVIAYTILQKFVKVEKVLEIGVYGGYTLLGWLGLNGVKVQGIGVDINLRTNAPLPVDTILIEGDSHNPSVISHVKEFCLGGVDLLFIDGDHTLQGCLDDFNNYAPLVRLGGAVGFHDILNGDVRYTWREVVKRYPTIQVQNHASDGSRLGLGFAFRLPQVGSFEVIHLDEAD